MWMNRLAFGLLLLTIATNAQIVIDAGTVIDGKGAVLRNQRIVIEGSRIRSIGASPAAGGIAPTYNLNSMTIMPGWIDTHVHLDWHFDDHHMLADRSKEDPTVTATFAAENARATLLAGFTTVQSLGSHTDVVVRAGVKDGTLTGPRVLTSIEQITGASDAEAMRATVRRLKAAGADVIKIIARGDTPPSDQMKAACGEAHRLGLRALVHAFYSPEAQRAINAGCTSVEHGDFIDDETLKLMKEHSTYLDPNFLNRHNYLEQKSSFPFPPATFEFFEKALAALKDLLPRARKQGIQVVFGTDAVAGAHGRNAEEFIYRVREGHDKPMDALLSATSVAAQSLGLADQIGSIAPGMAGDLVATDGNPLDDITAVRRVVFVMRDGKVYKKP
jgi:imidazolonepropionase-like amidohydrolase